MHCIVNHLVVETWGAESSGKWGILYISCLRKPMMYIHLKTPAAVFGLFILLLSYAQTPQRLLTHSIDKYSFSLWNLYYNVSPAVSKPHTAMYLQVISHTTKSIRPEHQTNTTSASSAIQHCSDMSRTNMRVC